MKKAIVHFLFLTSALFALPVGNPQEALFYEGADLLGICPILTVYRVQIGFYGDYVFNRNLRECAGPYKNCTRIYTNAGYLAFNMYRRLDLFATLGTSSFEIKADSNLFENQINEREAPFSILQFDDSFSWSVGARGLLFQGRCLGIGFEGQYFRCNPKPSYFNNRSFVAQLDTPAMKWQEWQLGAIVAYEFWTKSPCFRLSSYAGIKYANAKLSSSEDNFDIPAIFFPTPLTDVNYIDLQNGKEVGYCLGLTTVLNDMCGVTVEGRFADEKALYIKMSLVL